MKSEPKIKKLRSFARLWGWTLLALMTPFLVARLMNEPMNGLLLKTVFPSKIEKILLKEGPKLSPQTRGEIALMVRKMSEHYAVDPILILAVIKVESHFNPNAHSQMDARGLMQVRPIVMKQVAHDLGMPSMQVWNHQKLYGHDFNIRIGVHYLASLIKKFHGNIDKALMAYNAGPTFVSHFYKDRPVPKDGYQGRVLQAYIALSNS